VRNQTAAISKEVAGVSGATEITNASTSATGAATAADTAKGLHNYSTNNNQQ
jgi:hypothetical protein